MFFITLLEHTSSFHFSNVITIGLHHILLTLLLTSLRIVTFHLLPPLSLILLINGTFQDIRISPLHTWPQT